MSQWDKLLSKIQMLSKDLRFAELKKVPESYGYRDYAPSGGSSHHTFRKAGAPPITVPKHESVKRVYVEMVRDLILSEEDAHEDA